MYYDSISEKYTAKKTKIFKIGSSKNGRGDHTHRLPFTKKGGKRKRQLKLQ